MGPATEGTSLSKWCTCCGGTQTYYGDASCSWPSGEAPTVHALNRHDARCEEAPAVGRMHRPALRAVVLHIATVHDDAAGVGSRTADGGELVAGEPATLSLNAQPLAQKAAARVVKSILVLALLTPRRSWLIAMSSC